MKKSEKIEILNSRRIKLKENSMRLREEKERLTRRLERLRNNLDEMEAEEATLESIIIDQLDFKKMMVSVHVVEEFTPTRSDRLTIELKRTYSIQVCQKVTIALIRFLQI
jgi:predicted nuclease with TOPRIM domain